MATFERLFNNATFYKNVALARPELSGINVIRLNSKSDEIIRRENISVMGMHEEIFGDVEETFAIFQASETAKETEFVCWFWHDYIFQKWQTYKAEVFKERVKLQFEDREFWAPALYERILTAARYITTCGVGWRQDYNLCDLH